MQCWTHVDRSPLPSSRSMSPGALPERFAHMTGNLAASAHLASEARNPPGQRFDSKENDMADNTIERTYPAAAERVWKLQTTRGDGEREM